ncbi:uncharacterized protein LOC132304680 [Cornus florida]|uniref:uncharacterized protein LOC132304680 n=1 Tax=Cornus florida TaxID=4283 RepID=UPI0028964DB2|nr:uncharacterized protein LOC132304680 [Cornus florida]
MPGIDPTIMEYRLNVNPDFKPVRQKRRTFVPERNQAISEEVEKLLKVDFIQEVYYPDWLENVVLVKKANGKWRLCVDFTDLNKACPNDSFPLPRIDMLVEGTAGHKLLSFMNAYSGYNQISMYTSDREKMAFITDRGLYCYKVMPFGLKNAGATYQRLVNAMFKHQIGRNMEVYIDDMLVKSLKAEDHFTDLQETFEVLRRHKMKLNPSKCAFGVSSGKFLGYMAFKELKQYLSSPPLLSRTIPGEELYIYLAVSTTAVSSALIQEEEGDQRPVYFVSKTLRGAEERYPRMEQLVFALIVSARKLRSYFQAHTIVVLTDQPLRQVLHKPESSGRLMKWSVELEEFDIQYKPRTAVKAQVLADFLAEFTPPEEEKQPQFSTEPDLSEQMGPEVVWDLFVDGSSNVQERQIEVQQAILSVEWADPIIRYIKDGVLPTDRAEARKVKMRAARYPLIKGVLNKRSFSIPYLRCVSSEEADYILREIHLGVCGNHAGGRSLTNKAIRLGYYWPTMQKDALDFVQKCDKCQRFANIPRQPSEEMTPMSRPYLFPP